MLDEEFEVVDFDSTSLRARAGTEKDKEEEENQTYVSVKDGEHGKIQFLLCNPDKALLLKTLTDSFPGATGLKFNDPGESAVRLDQANSLFVPPEDGWKNRVYTATFPPRQSHVYVENHDGKSHILPCNPDKTLSVATLVALFPGATGLKFNDPGKRVVGLDQTNSLFVPPEDGWKNRVYTTTFPPRQIKLKVMDGEIMSADVVLELTENKIARSTIKSHFSLSSDSVVKLRYDFNGQPNFCNYFGFSLDSTGSWFLLPIDWPTIEFFVEARLALSVNAAGKILETWEKRVFRIVGSNLTGSGVLIDRQRVLTAAHLCFRPYEWYRMEGPGGSFDVRCLFISNEYDFAILVSDRLPNHPPLTNDLKRGEKYCIMGYPNGAQPSVPTITRGIIEGTADDDIHLVGTPGSKRGYSGGPVFDDSGNLAGILIGGYGASHVNSTIQECLDSSAEQKYAKISAMRVLTTVISIRDTREKELEASRINDHGNRVLHIRGLKQSGSAVLCNGSYIVTAAHLEFKLKNSYQVKGSGLPAKGSSAACEFISEQHDFALLCLEDHATSHFPLPTAELHRDSEYFMMGYPGGIEASKPTVTKGIITGVDKNGIYDGTLYSNHDYSGAPIFADSGHFAGILISATTALGVPAEQKLAKILSIDAIYADHRQSREASEKKASRISTLGDRVVRIQGSNGSWGSGMLVEGRIFTAAAPLNLEPFKDYQVKGSGLPEGGMTCVFISEKHGFALLTSKGLPNLPLPTAELSQGSEYFIMSYPSVVENSELEVTTGIVEGDADGVYLAGTPELNQDCAGAPVFADPGNWVGMLIDASYLDSSGKTCARILRWNTIADLSQSYAKVSQSLQAS